MNIDDAKKLSPSELAQLHMQTDLIVELKRIADALEVLAEDVKKNAL